MKTFKPGDKVFVRRNIYRYDGPKVVVPRVHRYGTHTADGFPVTELVTHGTTEVKTRILYAQAGTEGTVLETFRGENGRWNVKVLVDGKCLTFRQTSIGLTTDKVSDETT